MGDSSEVFEAISHPVRIKILKILEKQPSSFASLKRQLNIDSSGNLDHHLKKLGPLITTNGNGLYALSDAGKEALVSIGAIEAWKDNERRKNRAFIRVPKMVFVLASLEILIAVASLIVEGRIISTSLYFSWYPLFTIYTAFGVLGLASAIGLLTGKSWGWMLVTIESALLLMSGPTFFMDSVSILIRWGFVQLTSSPYVFAPWLVMFPIGALTLFLALQPSLRESLGARYSTPMPNRALIGGALGILAGIINLPVAEILSHAYGGGVYALGGILNLAGLALAVGGILILLRKYLLGALLLIIIGSITVYDSFIIAAVIFANLSVPLGSGSLLFGALLFAMPIAAGVLALISRPKLRS